MPAAGGVSPIGTNKWKAQYRIPFGLLFLSRARQDGCDRLHQFVDVEGLAEVGGPAAEVRGRVALVVRRDGDRGQRSALVKRLRAEPLQECDSIAARHCEVRDDQVHLQRADESLSGAHVLGLENARAMRLEDLAQELTTLRMVVHDQHGKRREIGAVALKIRAAARGGHAFRPATPRAARSGGAARPALISRASGSGKHGFIKNEAAPTASAAGLRSPPQPWPG